MKTEEKYELNINYPGLCLIKANIVIINNKFTGNPKGRLKFSRLACRTEVREVEAQLLQSIDHINSASKEKTTEPFRFSMGSKKEIKFVGE